MPVFQAEHRTACNDMSAAFPPALRSSASMPQIPGALPPFQPVHRSLCFHKRRWVTVDLRISNRDCNTPDIQLDSRWISLVHPLKVTGPAGLHLRLLCQEPPIIQPGPATLVNDIQCTLRDKILLSPPVSSKTALAKSTTVVLKAIHNSSGSPKAPRRPKSSLSLFANSSTTLSSLSLPTCTLGWRRRWILGPYSVQSIGAA